MKKPYDKITKIQEIMTSEALLCWVMYSDENSDPFLGRFIANGISGPVMCILTPKRCVLLVNELDRDNVPRHRKMKISVVESRAAMWENAGKIIARLGYPPSIALNYSSMGDAQVDVLGYGMYQKVSRCIHKAYRQRGKNLRFVSADRAIYAYSDRKSADDIKKMRVAARRALEILETTFGKLKAGMTELQAAELAQSVMRRKPHYFRTQGVIAEETSWEPAQCPIVLAGPSLAKGAHAEASNMKIQPGQTIYFDFGVKLTFKDGSKWSSDIQRMGYVMRKSEIEPPSDIQHMFSVVINAIDNGMAAIRPGMMGFEVDEVVRNSITGAGFPDYGHATGHAIGELAHNPGTLFGPRKRMMARLAVQPNGVYTIEPRIALKNGGSVEEMVVVTKDGGAPLCRRQRSLYLIRP